MKFGAQTHGVWSGGGAKGRPRIGYIPHPACVMAESSALRRHKRREETPRAHGTLQDARRYAYKYTQIPLIKQLFATFLSRLHSKHHLHTPVLSHVVMLTHRKERRNDSQFSVVRMVLRRFYKSNKRKAFAYRAFRLFMGWVAGGTRTHDIQNHNLTL